MPSGHKPLNYPQVILGSRKFGISGSCFRFRAEECILVDKTHTISDFLSEKRPIHCILRPRRSGKTTMLSMFQTFFEATGHDDVEHRRRLFVNNKLKIHGTNNFASHFAQYTVFYFDFSNLKPDTVEDFRYEFRMILASEFSRLYSLGCFSGALDTAKTELIEAVIQFRDDHSLKLEDICYKLIQMIYESTGRKSIILVDEYDTPLASAPNRELYNYMERFLREVFGKLFYRKNASIFGGLLVGILHCGNRSYLPAAPAVSYYPLSPQRSLYEDACLFTESEVRFLYEHVRDTAYSFSFDDLKSWYFGYMSAGQRLFNCWAVNAALGDNHLSTHWHQTGDADSLIKHIFGANQQFLHNFTRLLSGRPVKLTVRRRIYPLEYDKLTPTDIFGVMHYAGYLTEVEPDNYEIPNDEIRIPFTRWIYRHFGIVNRAQQLSFRGEAEALGCAVLSGTVKTFQTILRRFLARHPNAITKHRQIDRVMLYGLLIYSGKRPVLLKSNTADEVTLGFHDSATKTLAILIMRLAESKGSLQKAANEIISRTDFDPLYRQLPHEATTCRRFIVVLRDMDFTVASKIISPV